MQRERVIAGAALVLALAGCLAALADEILVDPNTSGGIQWAIELADPNGGDVIILANGTYTGDGNRDLDPNGKKLTIRSESDDPTLCIIDCGGDPNHVPPILHRAFYFHCGEGADTLIRGIGIENGYHDEDLAPECGGAILCIGAGPRIVNCRFSDNSYRSWVVGYGGGAIACRNGANPIIEHCVFENNAALGEAGNGGALFLDAYSTVILRYCEILNNTADYHGGALACTADSNLLAFHTRISGNRSASEGAIHVDRSDVTFFNCEISQHIPAQDFPAGRAIYAKGVSPRIMLTNCTLADNQEGDAWDGGSAIFLNGSDEEHATLTNCIVWRNTGANAIYANGFSLSYFTVSFSDTQDRSDWYGSGGNISDDPNFVEIEDGNDPFYGLYYLSHGDPNWGEDPNAISPCINTGDPNDATLAALGLGAYTTRRSLDHDSSQVDMGYHAPSDCDGYGRPDPLDLLLGNPDPNDPNNDWRYRDCNLDGIPDGCQPDRILAARPSIAATSATKASSTLPRHGTRAPWSICIMITLA